MAHRYKIYEPLGTGGTATVYRAYDSQMKRWVAVKRLLGPGGDPRLEAELRREANMLAKLASPHIVTVFDVADDEEGLFMVMELLYGDDLADLLEEGPLSMSDFIELAQQTLEALHTCHEHRIIHRDLKPANIKLDREASGRLIAKIIDFGICRTGMNSRKQTERQDGMILGSVHYMAPEQVGRTECDHRADLYSMGCIFYECLSGERPVESSNVFEMIEKHMTHDITSLEIVSPHLSMPLIEWLEYGLMSLKPEERFQTALEAVQALETIDIFSGSAPTAGSIKRKTGSLQPKPGLAIRQRIQTDFASLPVPLAEPPMTEAVKLEAPKKLRFFNVLAGIFLLMLTLAGGYLLYHYTQNLHQPPTSLSSSNVSIVENSDTRKERLQKRRQSSTNASASNILPPQSLNLSVLPLPDKQLYRFSAASAIYNFKVSGKQHEFKLAELGDAISYWQSSAQIFNSNLCLKTAKLEEKYAPIFKPWVGKHLRLEARALHFGQPSGGSACMNIPAPDAIYDQFSYGNAESKGFTLAVIFETDLQFTPSTLLRLNTNAKDTITVKMNLKEKLHVDLYNSSTEKRLRLSSEKFDTRQPTLLILIWDGAKSLIQLRLKGASGMSFETNPEFFPNFAEPLNHLIIGRTPENAAGEEYDASRQFHGHLGELVYYTTALDPNNLKALETALTKMYFNP